MLEIYTGTGKGKTTAALGLALRAMGHNMKVEMYSFLKDDPEYGEAKIAFSLPNFKLCQVGRDVFVNFKNPDPIDLELARRGWAKAKATIVNKNADLVILDEMNIVLATNMLPLQEAVEFLKAHKDSDVEIVLTGRSCPEEVIKIADLVTNMDEVKHYFHKGIQSRRGFDH